MDQKNWFEDGLLGLRVQENDLNEREFFIQSRANQNDVLIV